MSPLWILLAIATILISSTTAGRGPGYVRSVRDTNRDTNNSDCLEKPQVGPCRARMPRWAFDPKKNTCTSFIYGGCGGNKNNFETFEECVNTCGDKN